MLKCIFDVVLLAVALVCASRALETKVHWSSSALGAKVLLVILALLVGGG